MRESLTSIVSFFADIPANFRRVKSVGELEMSKALTRGFLTRHGEPVKTTEELREEESYIAAIVDYTGFYAFAYNGPEQSKIGLMDDYLEHLRDPGKYVVFVALNMLNFDPHKQLMFRTPGDETLAWLKRKMTGQEMLEGDVYRITSPELIERIENLLNFPEPVDRTMMK